MTVEGDLYNPFDQRLEDTTLLLCCYFNIGIEAEVGVNFEPKRTKSRILNYLLYCIYACKKLSNPNQSGRYIKNYINKVHYTPFNRRKKVVTDMKQVDCEPINLFGMNLP